MSNLTEKELMAVQEILSEEELLIKKFQMLAEHSSDPAVKAQMTVIAGKHQGHFNSIYSQLN